MSIEAMKLALEALQNSRFPFGTDTTEQDNSIRMLVDAIEQTQKQEPVADPEKHPNFYTWTWDRFVSGGKWRAEYGWKKPEGFDFANLQPLYTSPPKRQPLTDEQILDLNFDGEFCLITDDDEVILDFARLIEAAHGIKGEV